MHANPKISASKIFHLVLFLLVPLVTGQCSKKPVIFNFGDSNSDTGGYVAAHGFDLKYPYGRAFSHHSIGRFSDGRLIIDFLCQNLEANYLTHYLDTLEPNFTHGVNFAIAGAATRPLDFLFNLNIQVLQFKSRSTQLKSEGVSHLIGEEDFQNAIYTIDIGQNDLSFAFMSLSYSEAIDKIPFYLSEIKNAIWVSFLSYAHSMIHIFSQVSSMFPSLAFHVLICLLPLVVSKCNRNPVIFNFGDSNSDTGAKAAAYGLEIGYPYGRAFFHRATGRATDGRLIIDFFCEELNASYLTPYLDSIEPNFANGANFAVSSAATYPLGALFSLDIQVLQFKRFRNRSIQLHSKGLTQFNGEEGFKNALYTIDIGQNDLSYAFGFLSYTEAVGRIPSYISEIRNAIQDIYLLGGRNFWVHNTGPLGCLPRELATRNNVQPNEFDKYGCLKPLNNGVKLFNSKLKALCQELRLQLENSTVVYVDVYSIKYDLIANSRLYGFGNPLMACCGEGGQPYNYNPDNDCLGGRSNACEEGTSYISWDGTHYTEAANAIIVSKILSTKYSTPPAKLNFFCNGARTSCS